MGRQTDPTLDLRPATARHHHQFPQIEFRALPVAVENCEVAGFEILQYKAIDPRTHRGVDLPIASTPAIEVGQDHRYHCDRPSEQSRAQI